MMESVFPLSSFSINREKVFLAGLIFIPVIGGAFAFPLSYLTNSNELIGLCLLPFVLTLQKTNRRFNYIFLFLFLLFGFVAWIYSIRIFYFFSLAFYILLLIELFLGCVNLLTVFLFGFMSPLFHQVAVILGFPIRLQLSEMAGTLLQWTGVNIQIEGNLMLLNGTTFTVDTACMGLNMLSISMLMGVFILAYTSRIAKKSLKMKYLIAFFVIVFLLNIIANLFRIILLVLFRIAPENFMHEVVGLLCMILYIVAPLYLLGQWLVFRCGRVPATGKSHMPVITIFGKGVLIPVALCLMSLGIHIHHKRSQPLLLHNLVSVPGYITTQMDGVIKLVNNDALIYIKPIPEFFYGEHTPLFCWKGSGYTFKSIQQTSIGGHPIYYGQLVKNEEKLYTAWWYENGTIRTINQFNWRMRMMCGEEKFSLINVSAGDECTLRKLIQSIFEGRLFPLIK